MDTMTLTKAAAGLLGAWLFLLLGKWAAEGLYHVGGHGEASYVIETESEETGVDVAEVSFVELMASADADKGSKVFRKCTACHKLEAGANSTGPYLYGVVGRAVASVDGFGYSPGMTALGGDWTPERLNEFLIKPSAYVSGTSMSFAGLNKIDDRVNLVAFLNANSDTPFVIEAAAAAEAAPEQAAIVDEDTAVMAEEPAETSEEASEETSEGTAVETAEEAAPAAEAEAKTEVAATETAAVAGDAKAGAKVFKKCAACHKLEEGQNGVGPHLYGVIGRPVASVDGFGYSDALTGLGGDWTSERLDEYLLKPRDYAPGTKMTFAGLRKEADRANVIAYLDSLDN